VGGRKAEKKKNEKVRGRQLRKKGLYMKTLEG
jgi:hypothetical protein